MAKATKKKPIEGDADFPIYLQGIEEGKRQMKATVLTHLQEMYMDREVERTSPRGQAILEVATEVSDFFRSFPKRP